VFDVLLPLLSVAVVIAPLMFTVDAIAKTPLSKTQRCEAEALSRLFPDEALKHCQSNAAPD
jgi:hypothetical protein